MEEVKCDLLKLADCIDALLPAVHDSKTTNAYLHLIYEKQFERMTLFHRKPYATLDGNDALAAFVLNNWTFHENKEDNIRSIQALSVSIKNTFLPPTGNQLTNEQVDGLADSKFGIFDRLAHTQPIYIIIANNTCHYANALYYINQNPSVAIEDLIVLTSVSGNQVTPEFVLLHELGHLVHTRITGKKFTAPKSFDALHEIIFKYADTPARDKSKMPHKWVCRMVC